MTVPLPFRPSFYALFKWILLGSTIVFGAGVWLWHDYHDTLDRAAIQQINVARLLETHTSYVIANADTILERVNDEVRDHDIMSAGADRRWPIFSEMAKRLPASGRLWLYRTDGSAVMASHLRHSKNNASDREYFTAQKTPGTGLFIGETVIGKTTGNKVFNLSRRITAADGSFAGVAMAAIDIDVFIQEVRELKLGETAAYTLVRSDGAIIMRHPDAGATGKHFNLKMLDDMPKKSSGLLNTVSVIDGIERQVAYRKHTTLPIAIVVSLAHDEILKPWRQRALATSGGLAVLLMAASWLAFIARKATRRELRATTRIKTVLDTVADGICGINEQGRIVFINPAGARLLGYHPDELVGKDLHATAHHSQQDGAAFPAEDCPINQLLSRSGEEFGTDYFWNKSGQGFATEYAATRVADLDGKNGVVLAFRDTSAVVAARNALRESEARYRLLAENSHDVIWTLDVATGRFTYVSPSVEKLRGFTPEEVMAQPFEAALTPESAKIVNTTIKAMLERIASGDRSGLTTVAEIEQPHRCGHIIPTEVVTTWILDEAGHPVSVLGVTRNIAERKKAEKELERLAQTDSLTGLANRRHFMQQAEQELSRTKRYGGQLSVLMMDIDHFKTVNDTYGHQTGDLVLKALSAVCHATLREIDFVGRIGGEEFAIMLPQTAGPQAMGAAERLRQAIAGTGVPLEHGMPLHFTVSIGVATLADTQINLDTLFGFADKALYDAKHGGRNRACAHSGS